MKLSQLDNVITENILYKKSLYNTFMVAIDEDPNNAKLSRIGKKVSLDVELKEIPELIKLLKELDRNLTNREKS